MFEKSYETRLKAVIRIASLVRANVEANGGQYSGTMVPNIQSIIDICTVPDEFIPKDLDIQLTELEQRKQNSNLQKLHGG